MPSTGGRSSVTSLRIPVSSVVTVLAVLLGAWVLFVIRDIVLMVFVAFLLATLIDPFADWFERKHIPRALAVLAIYVVLLALFALIFALLIPALLAEGRALLQNFSQVWQTILAKLGNLQSLFGNGARTGFNIGQSIGILDSLSGRAEWAYATITGVLGGFISIVITLVMTFYMVVEEQPLKRLFKLVTPPGLHSALIDAMVRMQDKFGAWFRGQFILSLTVGILVYIGLKIVGAPYAAALALLAGLLEFVPYVGPTLAAIPAVLLALAESPVRGLLVTGVYVVIQQLENNLLVPKIMQRAVDINPVVSIVALLIGARLGGIVGALLAIPIAASIGVLVQDYFEERKKSKA